MHMSTEKQAIEQEKFLQILHSVYLSFSSQLDAFLNNYEPLSWYVSRVADWELKGTSILGFAFQEVLYDEGCNNKPTTVNLF